MGKSSGGRYILILSSLACKKVGRLVRDWCSFVVLSSCTDDAVDNLLLLCLLVFRWDIGGAHEVVTMRGQGQAFFRRSFSKVQPFNETGN